MAVIGTHYRPAKALRLAMEEFARRPGDPSRVVVEVYARGKKLPTMPVYPIDSDWPPTWRRDG